jgi:hypothetical protein
MVKKREKHSCGNPARPVAGLCVFKAGAVRVVFL